jgi:pimeloyl-ACP methyl ester carboxylesterase
MLASLIYRKDRAGPPYVDILQRPLHRSGSTAAIAAWLPALLQTDPNAVSAQSTSYTEFNVPMGIIWGAKDSVTPLDQLRQLKSLVPTASVTILPNTGHIPQVEDPIAFQRALIEAIHK